MERKIGVYASIVNLVAIVCFALSMAMGFDFGSYLSSLFIAFGFVPMMCAYARFARPEARLAGLVAVAFSAMYAAIVSLVYFAQLTSVRLNALSPESARLLDFQQFGLMFNYDLLGYAAMALSTFFAGLTIAPRAGRERCLKVLLMLHGAFFVSCLSVPMLGAFNPSGPKWPGVALLEFWCAYFGPISALSCLYFNDRAKRDAR